MRLFTPWYHIRLWSVRYLRWRDFVQALMLIPAAYLAVGLYAYRPVATTIVVVAYAGLVLLALTDAVRGRLARDYAQAEVLREFFSAIHSELFDNEERIRITLFRQSPFNKKYIVPWYRYTPGARNLIDEARKSQAKYQKGEGFTGDAWAYAGEDITLASFPAFENREEFERYYTEVLKIDPDTVRNISDHMVWTRTVLSHGFTDSEGEFLGVLSVDSQAVIEVTEDQHPRIGTKDFRADIMIQIFNSIEDVLAGFARVEKR